MAMADVAEDEAMAMAMDGKNGSESASELKKTSSYRYWVRSSTLTAPKTAPRPLTSDEITAKSSSKNGVQLAGSQWNQAGTWEEKVVSSWASSRVKALLPAVEPVEFGQGCTARVVEVTSCSGDASMVTVRQRKRVGYSFEIEMKYAVTLVEKGDGKAIEGKMKVPEACYGELDDLELEVTVSASDVKDEEKRRTVKQTLTKLLLPRIRGKLEEFEAELKER